MARIESVAVTIRAKDFDELTRKANAILGSTFQVSDANTHDTTVYPTGIESIVVARHTASETIGLVIYRVL